MACMCGDYCCPSCGPAQGNWRCPLCNTWASEVCEHLSDDGAGLKPEFQAQADEMARQEREAEDALVRDLEESERLAEDYWREQDNKQEDQS